MKKYVNYSLGILLAICPLSLLASTSSRLSNLESITDAQNTTIVELRNQLSSAYREIDDLRGNLEQVTRRLDILEKQQSDNNATESVTATTPLKNDKDVYDQIVDMILAGGKEQQAQTALERYIVDYPESRYIDNAFYWLGQLHFSKNENDQAMKYFTEVVRSYPKSLKAPESMYKVGVILERKGDKGKAKSVYQQVIKQYPSSSVVNDANLRLTRLF